MRVGAKKRSKNSTIIGLIAGGIVLFGFIGAIWYIGRNVSTDTEVTVSNSSFKVAGMYGATYEFDSVSTVELKEDLPEILEKSNAADIGKVKKGDFNLEGLGLCRLYLISEEGPYLYIKVNDFYVIINHQDKTRTVELYEELSGKIAK